jgi:hypothetical protein
MGRGCMRGFRNEHILVGKQKEDHLQDLGVVHNTDNWQTLVNVIMNLQLHKRQGIYRVAE